MNKTVMLSLAILLGVAMVLLAIVLNTAMVRTWLAGVGPMHRAALDNDTGELGELIERGMDPDVKDEDGYTPLHAAAENGHIDAARLLIEAGVDLEARSNDGYSPLIWAARWGPH